jgi:hypothetical protein
MAHSYEEIKDAALDILAERENVSYEASQYEHLKLGVAEVLFRRESGTGYSGRHHNLDREDSEIFLEVFWELFRQGIITLGLNDSNREFPFFRVSEFGKKILSNQSTYFFHDVTSYSKLIKDEIENINETTLLYLEEAMQAFRASCILSATVMLGVATEHTFLIMLETIEKNKTHKQIFKSVFDQKTILQKVNKFKNVLDQNIRFLPSEIKEDLDTHFAGILSVIRNFRNQAGHPSGKVIDREQTYVLLQLFIPYCKKLYQLIDHFKK